MKTLFYSDATGSNPIARWSYDRPGLCIRVHIWEIKGWRLCMPAAGVIDDFGDLVRVGAD